MASEFSLERIRVEQEQQKELEAKSKEVAESKKQQENLATQLRTVSTTRSSGNQLKEEVDAMVTGKTIKLTLQPSESYTENLRDHHFRLAESQFYRSKYLLVNQMLFSTDSRRLVCGASRNQYRVTEVVYVINPKLIERYNKTLVDLQSKARPGEVIEELLMFHGTAQRSIDAILDEGALVFSCLIISCECVIVLRL